MVVLYRRDGDATRTATSRESLMDSQQTVMPGASTPHFQEGMERLRAQCMIERLWARDVTLWSDEASVQETIRHRLGWLQIVSVMSAQSETLRRFAHEVYDAGFTHALLLGMGGSGLFAEVCRETIGVTAPGLDLSVLDTTDPTAILAHQRRCPPERLLAIISSKSGSTSEISALTKYF